MSSLLTSSIFSKQNIPNFITGSRIAFFLVDLLAIKYTYRTHEGMHMFFCVLGTIIYAFDWLDGFVARKYGWQSKFGAIFDPAGDKICAYSMLAYLYTLGAFPLWALAIVLFRDVVLSTIRFASLKYNFNFKTSQMGKLRTNIIGFGSGIIYLLHYWGEYYFIEIRLGFGHIVIIAITALTLFNIVRLPNRYMLKLFPRFVDKLGAVITFIIAALYPPYSIIISMVWITVYTLWDYGRAFKHEVDDARDEAKLKQFLSMAVMYSLLGICLTVIVIGLLKFHFVLSIFTAGMVFISLVVGKLTLIQTHKQATTSNTS